MNPHYENKLNYANKEEYYNRKKNFFLGVTFFLVIGGYTLAKEIKDFAFISMVGLEYLPLVKMLSMLVLLPLVFIYSRLVDILRRYRLFQLYSIIFGICGLIFAYFMAHPTIGLANTDSGASRLFGWTFYFFMEAYTPFVISILWAFVNSVTKPENIKRNYITMTASAKAGGAIFAGFAWWWLYMQDCGVSCFSSVIVYELLLIMTFVFLLSVPFIIAYMMRKVPGRFLHGYEAVYKLEKARSKEVEIKEPEGLFSSIFSGLYLLVRYPYVFGIFGMIFFWEVINVIFNYLRLGIGQAATESPAAFGVFLYKQACITHVIGFIFVIFGTRVIVSKLGVRRSLIAVPVLIGASILYYLSFQTLTAATTAYIVMRAVNYSLAYPLRESLYIPTTKDVKFKTKSWIDGFGAKISKGSGSCYNYIIQGVAKSSIYIVNVVFFTLVIAIWTVMASFLGRRFEKVVKNDEVIGTEE